MINDQEKRWADKTAINPHYRSGPKMKLWARPRVSAAEVSPEFLAHLRGRRARRERAQDAADERREKLLTGAREMEIKVERIDLRRLFRLAANSWKVHQAAICNYGASAADADELTQRRWAVNSIRHHLCSYEAELERVSGRARAYDARRIIRRRVLGAIAETYPELRSECDSQLYRQYQLYSYG